MAVVEASEYKGNQMIVLKDRPDSSYPFQFGRQKAKLIVECYEAIKLFADTGVFNTTNLADSPVLPEGGRGPAFNPPRFPLETPEPSIQPVPADDIPF